METGDQKVSTIELPPFYNDAERILRGVLLIVQGVQGVKKTLERTGIAGIVREMGRG